jgi:L-asparaginase
MHTASTSRPHCVLLSTGGTIASRIDPGTGLALPVISGADLITALPELENIARVTVEDFARIASPHVSPEEWVDLTRRLSELLARSDVCGVVVSHGTSTLEETAWFLDLTLDTEKPVVVIGSQRNASELGYDGPGNLLNAFRICAEPQSRGKGVMVALNQHINAAREVTKTHTFDVETFNSGEWGYLGNVTAKKVVFHRQSLKRLRIPLAADRLPKIDVVAMYPGATGNLVHAAIADGAAGLVVQGVGSGHVNQALYAAVLKGIEHGIPIVITTRIPRGGTRASYGFEGSSSLLQDAGAILAGDLSSWKARIVLMLALQNGKPSQDVLQSYFDA